MRVVVGYEVDEEAGTRKAIYAERGPGRARGGGLSAIDATEARLPSGGDPVAERAAVATIERRRLSPEEFAERTRPKPNHSWRQATVPARRTPPTTTEEPDPMSEPAQPRVLGDVVVLPVEAMPCPDCSHLRVCRIRLSFEETRPELLIPLLPEGLHVAITPAISCDFFLAMVAPEVAPETVTRPVVATEPTRPVRAPARRQPGGVVAAPRGQEQREAEMVDALRAGGNAIAASKILGISPSRVNELVRRMRAAGRLPADLAATLRTRPFRKARG